MVRAGENAFLIDDFKDKNIIAIGWNYLGDLKKYHDKEEIKDQLKKENPAYRLCTIIRVNVCFAH